MILLNRAYAGYPAGQIVELPASTEAALIASGGASASSSIPTAGNVTTTALSGCITIAAGQTNVVITNSNIVPQSLIWAQISMVTAPDATLLYVARVAPIAGQVTIAGNAAATGNVTIDWAIMNPTGTLSNPT